MAVTKVGGEQIHLIHRFLRIGGDASDWVVALCIWSAVDVTHSSKLEGTTHGMDVDLRPFLQKRREQKKARGRRGKLFFSQDLHTAYGFSQCCLFVDRLIIGIILKVTE